MSGESIVCERRNRSDDFGAELDGQCDENDGNITKSRRAFERQRSWKSGSDARSPGLAEGAAGARTPLGRYRHNFFSEEMASCRVVYLKLIGRATILVLILTWSCLPIYWASLSSSAELTGNLEAWVINRDQARIGDSLSAAVLAAPTSGHGALRWHLLNASHYPGDGDVIQAVVQEQTWLAVVVNTNASTSLSQARAIGNTSYDPSSAITVYYAQARNEVVTGVYLLPAASGLLSNFTVNYATSSAQRYLATIVSQDNTSNLTALQGIAQAPQTISPGIGYSLVNLRPYTTPTAQAPLLVGQIYLCIFAFIVVMAHSTARARIEKHLTLPSYLLLRILTPLIVYLPLSLSYALLNLAFRLPFGTHFSFSAGFLAFFGFLYLGMASLGLALEAMVTLLQPGFVPMFLVLLLIVNVSTAALPAELQPRLYSYSSGFQFWNIQQALRTIFFDTYSHLPRNAGILVAWVIISCCTTALFTWLVRAREVRSAYRLGVDMDGGGKAKDVEYGREKKGEGVVESVVVVDDVREGKLTDESEIKRGKGKGSSSAGAGAGGAFKRWEKMKDNSARNAKLEEERSAPESSGQSKSGLKDRGR